MVFDIKGKIALITGGATGIGLQYSVELLKNGLQVFFKLYLIKIYSYRSIIDNITVVIDMFLK